MCDDKHCVVSAQVFSFQEKHASELILAPSGKQLQHLHPGSLVLGQFRAFAEKTAIMLPDAYGQNLNKSYTK